MKAIIGRKVGMTQIFTEDGSVIPVTVIEAGPCAVVQVKTTETDGYNAVQLGFGDVKESKLNKPEKGHFAKANVKIAKHLREFRMADVDVKVGDEVNASVFADGETVDIQGTTKGKGFQGVIKRHGQHRGPMGHGSMYHRRPGSMGATSTPGRVFKGKKLAEVVACAHRNKTDHIVLTVEINILHFHHRLRLNGCKINLLAVISRVLHDVVALAGASHAHAAPFVTGAPQHAGQHKSPLASGLHQIPAVAVIALHIYSGSVVVFPKRKRFGCGFLPQVHPAAVRIGHDIGGRSLYRIYCSQQNQHTQACRKAFHDPFLLKTDCYGNEWSRQFHPFFQKKAVHTAQPF